jgi:hypothetical protein
MNEETENNLLQKDNPMKEWLVNYVGQKLQPQDGGVTIEMIVEAMAQEFPEFLLEVAKENWIRGYQQALYDIDNNELTKNEQETAESS